MDFADLRLCFLKREGMIVNSTAVHGDMELLFMFRSTFLCHCLGNPGSCCPLADRRPSVQDGLSSVSPHSSESTFDPVELDPVGCQQFFGRWRL